eukprot:gene440-1081_t
MDMDTLINFMAMNTTSNFTMNNHIYQDYAMGAINSTLVTATCVLSMLGSLIIIVTFLAWKDIRTVTRHVLFCLSISDFLVVLGNISGTYFAPSVENRDIKCVVQSFVTTSASIISCFWTTTLAIYLYMVVVKGKQRLARRLLIFFHILNWTVGPFINAIAVWRGMLGDTADEMTAGWCWIAHSGDPKDRNYEILWMLLDGKIAEFIAYGTILILYSLIKLRLHKELMFQKAPYMKKHLKMAELKAARVADRKLIFIPILLILARFWGTLRFILFWASELPKQNLTVGHKILLSLQGIGDSSQGMLNCILFCFWTPTVSNRLKDFFLDKVFCCKSRRKLKSHISTQTVHRNSEAWNDSRVPKASSNFNDPLLPKNSAQDRYGAID